MGRSKIHYGGEEIYDKKKIWSPPQWEDMKYPLQFGEWIWNPSWRKEDLKSTIVGRPKIHYSGERHSEKTYDLSITIEKGHEICHSEKKI